MQVFKIKQDGFKEIKKQMLIRATPLLLITLSASVIITSINSNHNANTVSILPFYIPFILILVSIGVYRGVKRQMALFNSYTLTISNNLISRDQLNTPPISIYFNDIKEIIKHKNGSFTIKGKETGDLIGVPPQIDNYPQLEEILNRIQPITIKNKLPFLQKYPSLTGLLTVGLMFCVYVVNNKLIVGLAGVTLVSFMVWSLIKIQNSKNVDSKTKKNAWWVLIVLVSVITVMVFKLT